MIKRGNKGQFYLLAAFVIIIALISLASVSNRIMNNSDSDTERVYDLSKELSFESAKVVDYGIYNSENTSQLIDSWASNYTEYSQTKLEDVDIVFVYGNSLGVTSYKFEKTSSGSIGFGSIKKQVYESAKSASEVQLTGKKVKVKDLDGVWREFDLKPGENFYFIITKDSKEGKIIKGSG